MATFQKRSGSWRAIIRRKDHGTLTKTFVSKEEAERWAREQEVLPDKRPVPGVSDASDMTLETALRRYAQEVLPLLKGGRKDLSKATILCRYPISSLPLAKISGQEVEQYRDVRMKNVSPATVLKEIGLISRVFNVAIREWGFKFLKNPVQNVQKPKTPPGRSRRLKEEEIHRILQNTSSEDLKSILPFALDTGMRQEEITELCWEHVDLEKGIIHLFDTENGDRREATLSPIGVKILESLSPKSFGKVWNITPHGVSVAFRRARSRARKAYEEECERKNVSPGTTFLMDLHFNDIRHEVTSQLFEKGFNLMEVTMMTGRKDPRMLKHYVNSKVDLDEMIQKRRMSPEKGI